MHTSTSNRWEALSNTLPVQDSANHPLDDVKADKEERKYKTLIQNRIEKRLVFESGSELQILAGKQHLCQH